MEWLTRASPIRLTTGLHVHAPELEDQSYIQTRMFVLLTNGPGSAHGLDLARGTCEDLQL